MSDKSYKAGYDAGRDGDFWDDIAQNIGTPGDEDFDKGFKQGQEDRNTYGPRDKDDD